MSIEFHNWVYLTETAPAWYQYPVSEAELERIEELRETVRRALAELSDGEQQVVRLIHYDGHNLNQVAQLTGNSLGRVCSLYRRARRRLQGRLRKFVRERYNLEVPEPVCPICASPERAGIERLIRHKRKEEPYSVLFREIKVKFGTRLISPKTVIGHVKYHGCK